MKRPYISLLFVLFLLLSATSLGPSSSAGPSRRMQPIAFVLCQ